MQDFLPRCHSHASVSDYSCPLMKEKNEIGNDIYLVKFVELGHYWTTSEMTYIASFHWIRLFCWFWDSMKHAMSFFHTYMYVTRIKYILIFEQQQFSRNRYDISIAIELISEYNYDLWLTWMLVWLTMCPSDSI